MYRSVNGTPILVIGILGLVLCPIFALIAWSMGHNAIRQLDEEGVYDGSDRGMANAGRILGIIGSFLWLGLLLLQLTARQQR